MYWKLSCIILYKAGLLLLLGVCCYLEFVVLQNVIAHSASSRAFAFVQKYSEMVFEFYAVLLRLAGCTIE